MKLSVIIPAYNEAALLPRVAEVVSADCARIGGEVGFSDYEVIFANDGSTDDTLSRLEGAALRDPHIRVVTYERNKGKGGAVREGMLASLGDICIYTDCDLAYGTEVIGQAVKQLTDTGADMLIGSRALHPEGYAGYTVLRRVASVVYLRFLAIVAGFSLSDSQCGFKAMRGEAARSVFSHCKTDGFAFDFEVILRAQRAGLVFTEMPVKVINHRASKVHLIKDSIRMMGDILRIKKMLKSES